QRGRARRRGPQRDAGCDGAGRRDPRGAGQRDGVPAGPGAGRRRAQRSRAFAAVAPGAGHGRDRGGGPARVLAGPGGRNFGRAVAARRVRAGGRGDRAGRAAGRTRRRPDAVVLCGGAGGGRDPGDGHDAAPARGARVKRPFLALAVLMLVACGAPPWNLGKPLDGRPSIPPSPATVTPHQAAADAKQARASGRRVLEIAEKLTRSSRGRLAELLVARAADFHALGRAIPESADLEEAARLDETRGAQLTPARAVAAAAAGDAWKAIGAREPARAAFAHAAALGGVPPGEVGIMPRRRAPAFAAGGKPPADVDAYVLEGASLSARLLPLVAAFPWLLDHRTRALFWADALLAEDPTSPDVLELVAEIFGRAGRFGGTERMLTELTYYSPDRAAGIARGAAVWARI